MTVWNILSKRKKDDTDWTLVESWTDVNLQEELRNGEVQFPHCDSSVLHAPGECEYCDRHKDWQILRHMWGINFTGHKDPTKIPCPAERFRTTESIESWGGNVPVQNGQYAPRVDPQEIAETTERLLALLERIQNSKATLEDEISLDLPDQDS